jgi:hypothetical protein
VKVIRVLVYEGDDETLRSHLRRRWLRGRTNAIHEAHIRFSITEHFVPDDDDVDVHAWLGETVDPADVRAATEVVDRGGK